MLKNWLSACDRGGVALIVLVSFSGKLISPRNLCPHNMPHEFRWWQRIQEQTADLDQDIDRQWSPAWAWKIEISLTRERFGVRRSLPGHGKFVWEWGLQDLRMLFFWKLGRPRRIAWFMVVPVAFSPFSPLSPQRRSARRCKRRTNHLIPL